MPGLKIFSANVKVKKGGSLGMLMEKKKGGKRS